MSSYDRILFGTNLKELRTKARMSQQDLANKLGVSQNTVSNWESGNREPDSIELFLQIADIFGVTLDELLKSNQYQTQFTNVDDAMLFIIQNPAVAAYGGYDLDKMSDQDKIEFANQIADTIKFFGQKYNK